MLLFDACKTRILTRNHLKCLKMILLIYFIHLYIFDLFTALILSPRSQCCDYPFSVCVVAVFIVSACGFGVKLFLFLRRKCDA